MGLPTTMNPVNDESDRRHPHLRLWTMMMTVMEWTMTVAAIMAVGMLFSTALIPDVPPTATRSHAVAAGSPYLVPSAAADATTSTRIRPKTTDWTEQDSPTDLPELFDTTDWPTTSHRRQQPFLEKLTALNFTKPVWKSADYRLSGTDVPSLYEVHLNVRVRGVDGAMFSQIDGKVRVHFERVGKASDSVELHMFGQYVLNTSVICDARPLTTIRHYRDNVKQTVIVTVKEKIKQRSTCVLDMEWGGGLATTDNAGFYETWFTRQDGNLSVSLTTHGETMHTRKWMPCFDEPNYKAPLKLSIEHPSRLTALSNAPAKSTVKGRGTGRSTTTFEQTWPLSSYLYAFSVFADYAKNETIVDGLPVAIYVPATLSASLPRLTKEVSEVIPVSLNMFNATRINKKLDFIFFPDHSSAMENPGHISLGTGYIVDKKDTLMHEMMHQYFGNLVTNVWWSDVWINEGLANYYEQVAMDGDGTTKFIRSVRGLRSNSMREDHYDTSIPLHYDVNTFIESRHMFRIPYSKGASVLHMLRDYVGKADFDAVIEQILRDRANSTLSHFQFCDFLAVTGGERGRNAANIARDFLEQAGYPLLLIRHTAGAAVIRQVRFHRGFVDEKQRDFDTRWTLPIHFTTLDGNYSRTVVMGKDASEMTLNYGGLLIADPSKVVNYRVVYDRQTYKAIRASNMSESDKDYIESDLVEAAYFGYVDVAATYDTVMKRRSKKVVERAHEHVMDLFGDDKAKHEETTKLLEKLSGRKLSRRYIKAPRNEHPLRMRRDNEVSDISKDDNEEETEEEWWKKLQSTFCPKIRDMKKALIEYNKLGQDGQRNMVPLQCIVDKLNFNATEKWLTNLFDNHDPTFHMLDFGFIARMLEKHSASSKFVQDIANATSDNFMQDFIVDKLPKRGNYYKTSVFQAVHALFEPKHIDQLTRLIATQRAAAAENWIDIANIFEQYFAAETEKKILGPKIIEALTKLSQGL